MTLSRRHQQAKWFRTVVFFLALCAGAQAGEFAGGTGTREDPYQIATLEQLRRLSAGYGRVGEYYVLTADIDCPCAGEDLPAIWAYGRFEGMLDGNSHTIRNGVLEAESGTLPVFPELSSFGMIRNLTVENCVASAGPGAVFGFLCGTNRGQIINCHVTNCAMGVTYTSYRSDTEYDVGALVGVNQGVIKDCRAEGVIIVRTGQPSPVGGLIGRNLGVVQRCAAQGTVVGSGYVGGLVGSNSGVMEACVARMTVPRAGAGYSSTVASGGLVGYNQGRIRDCYAAGSVSGGSPSGGLVGRHKFGEIVRCYSTAVDVPSYQNTQDAGPFVGEGDASTIRDCYYLSLPGLATVSGGPGTPLSFAEISRRESYQDWGFFDDDPAYPWFMPENGCPVLAWELEQDVPVVAGLDLTDARRILEEHGWQVGEIRSDYSRQIAAGQVIWTFPSGRTMPGTPIDVVVSQGRYDWSAAGVDPEVGTAAHPLQIATAGQLEALIDFTQSETKYFELTTDVDMAGRVLPESPLGDSRRGYEKSFSGTLQGNGFAISNLTLRVFQTGGGMEGLVGRLAGTGKILNLSLTQAVLTAYTPCSSGPSGVLVGLNQGMVQRCCVRDVIGAGWAGALAGANQGLILECCTQGFICAPAAAGWVRDNEGTVDRCFSDAWVMAEGGSGGLVGRHTGQLTNCYNLGSFVAMSAGTCGTLVGWNSGHVACCYTTGAIVSGSQGTVAGYSMIGTGTENPAVNCYYRAPSGYTPAAGTPGTALSDARMRHGFSFRDWDFWGMQTDGFEDAWFMPADGYPLLAWQCGTDGLPAVPPVLNLYVYEALSRLQSAGITATARYEFDNQVPVSHVIRTEVGSTPDDEAVRLVASLGPCKWTSNRGDGSEANPFIISLASQLFSLAEHPELWDRCFVLTADLDLGWTPLDRALIAADANAVQRDFQGPRFNGTFDGTGHTLTNLTIASAGNYLGLFGALGPNACITHLHVDNACIAGAEYVGPIAGISEGVLDDCHTSGWITGSQYIGALVGYATGTLKGCSSTIEGAPYAGRSKRGVW